MSVSPSRSFTWQPRRRICERQMKTQDYPNLEEPRLLLPRLPECSYLIANDVYLMLHLGHPLANDGEQLWNGGLRVKQNFLARRVIGVKEGESWRKKPRVTPGKLTPFCILREGDSRSRVSIHDWWQQATANPQVSSGRPAGFNIKRSPSD